MNLFEYDIETIPTELLRIRCKEMIGYIKYLQVKVNEYEKYYNVETSLRQKTPFVRFSSQINKVDAIETVRIPERKFYVYKPYIKDAKELINEYFGGE